MADEPLAVNDRLVIPAVELTWRFSTSGGPGGQHANTAHTRAEVRWDVAASAVVTEDQRRRIIGALGPVVTVAVDDTRSQSRNRDLARERLAARIRESLVTRAARRPSRPGRGARERRLQDKRRRSRTKADRARPRPDD